MCSQCLIALKSNSFYILTLYLNKKCLITRYAFQKKIDFLMKQSNIYYLKQNFLYI